ncbi:MAG: hypothetical protein JRG96_04015 [Deltaproteobacteria bacterium]|nr:hypothetical protein [Deltaproteobacteria bacterium]MBW2420085.1 hypothetical protein [Deltaproteobacteria bacterium]
MMSHLYAGSRVGLRFIVLLFWVAGSAAAAPLSVTIETLASGSIGVTEFSDMLFVLEFTGDTEDTHAPAPGVVALPGESATVFLGGIGLATVTTGIEFFVSNSGGGMGVMSTQTGLDLIDLACDIDCSTWDLTTSFGPVSDPYPATQGTSVETDLGTLTLSSTYLGATMTASVPEPGSGLLVTGGLLLLAASARMPLLTSLVGLAGLTRLRG